MVPVQEIRLTVTPDMNHMRERRSYRVADSTGRRHGVRRIRHSEIRAVIFSLNAWRTCEQIREDPLPTDRRLNCTFSFSADELSR